MKHKKKLWNPRSPLTIILVIVVILFFLGLFYVNWLNTGESAHPIAPNQSKIIDILDNKSKKYTQNHFNYEFQYPAGYTLGENMNGRKDGYYRQTVLSKDASYDIENKKFLSGSIIFFYFYTDRTVQNELDSIKSGNNNEVEFTNSTFKGFKSVEIKFNKYPDEKRIFIPRSNGFLSIDYGYGPNTPSQLVDQYKNDYKLILSSFSFIN